MCDRFRVIFFVKKNFLYYNPMSEEINSFTINTTSQNKGLHTDRAMVFSINRNISNQKFTCFNTSFYAQAVNA